MQASAQWHVRYWNHGSGVVQATAKGALDLVLVTQKALETLKEGGEHSSHRFLIDDRQADLALDTLEIYALPKTLEHLGLRRDALVAVVYTATSPTARDFQFFETVASNQGFRVRAFTSIDAAMEWLTQDGEAGEPRST